MFTIEKDTIDKATGKLKELLGDNLVFIIAFGSRVRGDFSGDSDFDILVVVKERNVQIMDTINDIFGDSEDRTGIPFSVVVKTLQSFEKERSYNTTFYRNIIKEGVVFYDRSLN